MVECRHANLRPLGGCAAFDLETGERNFNCTDCGRCVTGSDVVDARKRAAENESEHPTR